LLTPNLASVSRNQDEKLDPRACLDGAAYSTPLAALPSNDPFFTAVNYKGAFSAEWNELWVRNWTALDRNNHLAPTPIACIVDVTKVDLNTAFRIYPNPAHDQFVIESAFAQPVNVEILDMTGRLVAERIDLPVGGGVQPVQINTLAKGIYVIKFRTTDGAVSAKKLIVE
jgi:hypothetical protein